MCAASPLFAAEISLASAPPVVVKTVPVAGATDVDPALTEIKVTYSKAMQDGSWSWSTWGEENYPETTGSPKYLQDGRTCVLPVRLQPNKFYAIWLNSDKFKNFTDTSGRPAVPYLLTFFTGEGAGDAARFSEEGWRLWQSGRPLEAIPKFELAVKRNPKNSAAWNGLGWSRFNSGHFAEAEKAFSRVIELEPNHPAALNGLGQVFLARGKYGEAESYLLKASAKAPAAWYGLARLYLLQGKFEDAEKYAERIVDSGQADETARAMLRAAKARKLNEGLRLIIEPQGASTSLAPQRAADGEPRKFVRLVVGKDEMTFEGKPITRDQLEGRLAEVPDRAHTVLEVALTPEIHAANDSLTMKQYFELQQWVGQLATRLGFEYLSQVGVHPLGSKGGQPPKGSTDAVTGPKDVLLNDDQRAVLDWTDRQFRSFFDERTFDGWSEPERATLERKLIDSLRGPRSTEYYQAINTLAALRSTKALPALREIAYDRREKDNRDRWMAVRAIGLIGDKSDVPELIPLVYHGNVNTRWWAQISLVRLTGQNFGKDWNAWGRWWNNQNGQPPYQPEIIRWWSGQPDSGKLAGSLEESDQKFLSRLKPKAAAARDQTEN